MSIASSKECIRFTSDAALISLATTINHSVDAVHFLTEQVFSSNALQTQKGHEIPQPSSNINGVANPNGDGVVHRWGHLFTANTGTSVWNVFLIKEGNQLKYRLESSQKLIEGVIPFDVKIPIDVIIKALIQKTEPVLEDETTVSFSSILKEGDLPPELEGQVRKVRLLRGRNNLVWQQWDSIHQTRTYLPLQLSIPSPVCSKDTQKQIIKNTEKEIKYNLESLKYHLKSCAHKFRCKDIRPQSLTSILATPRTDHSAVKNECELELKIDQKGNISIKVGPKWAINRDLDRSIPWFPNQLEVFFCEQNNESKLFFVKKEESNKFPWNNFRKLYSVKSIKFTGQDSVFIIELESKTLLPIFPHFYKTQCQQTLHAKDGYVHYDEGQAYVAGRLFNLSEDSCPHFELSFPREPRLQLPKQMATCAIVEPIFASSAFDDTVAITHFKWAVTLVAYQGSEDPRAPAFMHGNHAEGILEALNDGFFPEQEIDAPIRILFHFTGKIIEVKPVKNPKWIERTIVYPVDPDKGKELCKALVNAAKELPPAYNVGGIGSLFGNKGHSCFTWIRDYLKIVNVDLGSSFVGFIGTRTKNWTEKNHPPQNGYV